MTLSIHAITSFNITVGYKIFTAKTNISTDMFIDTYYNTLYHTVVATSSVGYGSGIDPLKTPEILYEYIYMFILGNFFYAFIIGKTLEFIEVMREFITTVEAPNEQFEAQMTLMIRKGTGDHGKY